MSLSDEQIQEMISASNEEWDRRRLRAELRAEFFALVGVFMRLVWLPALPPLLAWVWLGKLGVKEGDRLLAVTGISLVTVFLVAWLFVHLWKANSEYIRKKHQEKYGLQHRKSA